MPFNSKSLSTYHCACARDLHRNVICANRTLNFVYLSLFLDMFPIPTPRPKMSFGQRNVATYIHNLCKRHLGSRGELGCRTLTSGAKYLVLKYTEASTVQIYKTVSCRHG